MKLALTATPSQARFAPLLLRGEPSEAFAAAAQWGYDGVELHLRDAREVKTADIVTLMKKHNLSVPTLGTGLATGEDGLTFSDPDPHVRQQALERIKGHVELAAAIDSAVTIGLIRGRVGLHPRERSERMALMMDGIAQCCQFAATRRVTIVLEPLNRYECDNLNTVIETVDAVKSVGAANLRVLIDTFHMNIEDTDLAASIKSAASLLGHVHLVDSNRQAPGNGHLDMQTVLHALKDAGYDGFLSFEVLPLPTSEIAAQAALRHTQELLDME